MDSWLIRGYNAEEVAARLREARKESGLTGPEIAERYARECGREKTTHNTISRYINHPDMMTEAQGEALCRAMGTSLHALCSPSKEEFMESFADEARGLATEALGVFFALGPTGRYLMLENGKSMLRSGMTSLGERAANNGIGRLIDNDETLWTDALKDSEMWMPGFLGIDRFRTPLAPGHADSSWESGVFTALVLLGESWPEAEQAIKNGDFPSFADLFQPKDALPFDALAAMEGGPRNQRSKPGEGKRKVDES